MQENRKMINALTDDSEYARTLKFCIEHRLSCFEYYYRHQKAGLKKANRIAKSICEQIRKDGSNAKF